MMFIVKEGIGVSCPSAPGLRSVVWQRFLSTCLILKQPRTKQFGAVSWFVPAFRTKLGARRPPMTPSFEIVTQAEKGRRFRALHEREGAFIIPNPFDVGTALLLAHLGFEALATTSAGYAFTIGRQDGALTREQALAGG